MQHIQQYAVQCYTPPLYIVCFYRNRIRQYPALVNCTTLDWFSEWPRDALLEVAERYLDGLTLGNVEGVRNSHTCITQPLGKIQKPQFSYLTATQNYS